MERKSEHEDHEELIKAKAKKPQVRSKSRNNMALEMKLKNITVKDYRLNMIAEGKEHVPSEAALRQMTYEERHKFDFYKSWRDNLIASAITSETHIRGTFQFYKILK